MKQVYINDKWPVYLLDHIADLPSWKFWEKERMSAMYAAVRCDDTILDIGTCNGDMSAVFASWVKDAGKIILVEPSPDFWPVIRQHFEINNLQPYMAIQALVFNETLTPLDAVEDDGWPSDSLNEVKLETGFAHVNERPILPIVKIDDMGLPPINIITMDIEGTEYEALQGAEQTILKDKPTIFVSVHPEFMWREHQHSPDDLHVMMKKWGYDATYLAFDHEQHWMYKYRGEL